MVCGELQLDAIRIEKVVFQSHDSGVVYKKVEFIDLAAEFLCCFADGRKVAEVKLEVSDCQAGVNLEDLVDHGLDFGKAAAGKDEEFWFCGGEVDCCLTSNAPFAWACDQY